jgi:hypothetical protein
MRSPRKEFLGLLAVACVTGSVSCAPLSDAEQTELLKKATDWEVPQPSERARLVKIESGSRNGQDVCVLGFVEPETPEKAMTGLEWEDLSRGVRFADAKFPLDLDDVVCGGWFAASQETNLGLVTGIQLLRRDRRADGLKLIEKSLAEEAGHHRSPFRIPPGETAVLTLARSCLADVINDITSDKPDYPHLLKRLRRLLADQPSLKSEATDWAVTALEASVAHPPAEAGTLAAMIDDYLLSGGVHGAMRFHGERSAAETALILKGFEAVPAILAQLDSKRITNHLMQGFNNFTSYPMQADAVLQDYLRRLANSEFGSNWLQRQQGGTPGRKAVEAWWEKARETGERDYVAENLLRPDPGSEEKGAYTVSDELLIIAADRYPERLPGIYRKLLASPTSSEAVAGAIAASKVITGAEKEELFAKAVTQGRDGHRNPALAHLLDLDPAKNEARLIHLLDHCPKTPKRAYWLDQDPALARFVSESVNPAVWEALHRTLGRVDLGMRMEMIDALDPSRDAPRAILASYFKIYDDFGRDATVRNTSASPKFSGPGAGFPHDRIRVMDFIHREFATWLELDVEPPEDGATLKEWDRYRAKVKPAIEAARPR